MNIDVNALLKTLPIDLYGMGGIFVVMAIVYLCVKLVGKVFNS
mgnify:CR=1 FL=1